MAAVDSSDGRSKLPIVRPRATPPGLSSFPFAFASTIRARPVPDSRASIDNIVVPAELIPDDPNPVALLRHRMGTPSATRDEEFAIVRQIVLVDPRSPMRPTTRHRTACG